MTIRRRILITFTLIVLVGGLVQLLIAGSQLQTATFEFFRHHLETEALIASASLANSFEEHGTDEGGGQTIQRILANVQREVGYEFTLLDSDRSSHRFQRGRHLPNR